MWRGKCVDASLTLLNSYLNVSVPAGYVASLPTSEQLALELFGGMVWTWPTDGQFFTMKLSVKYGILHKIAITNWFLTIHMANISASLAQIIYQIGIKALMDVGELIF